MMASMSLLVFCPNFRISVNKNLLVTDTFVKAEEIP